MKTKRTEYYIIINPKGPKPQRVYDAQQCHQNVTIHRLSHRAALEACPCFMYDLQRLQQICLRASGCIELGENVCFVFFLVDIN